MKYSLLKRLKFIPPTQKKASRKLRRLGNWIVFFVLLFSYILISIKIISDYRSDFEYIIKDSNLRYIFEIFSIKLLGISLLVGLLFILLIFLFFRITVFLIIDLCISKGAQILKRILFSKSEQPKLESVNNYKIKFQYLLIGVSIGLFIFLCIPIINYHTRFEPLGSTIVAITPPFIILSIVLFSIANYFQFTLLYRDISYYKLSFVRKYSIYRILIAFGAFILLILIINFVLPLSLKLNLIGFEYLINFISDEITSFETYLATIFEKNQYAEIINTLRNNKFFKAIIDTKKEMYFKAYVYPFSQLIVFLSLIIFTTSIILPQLIIWGYRKASIVVIALLTNFIISNFLVNYLKLDKIFADKFSAIIIVYIILTITLKVSFDEIEKHFSSKILIKCRNCEAYCKKEDNYCRICGNEMK